MVVRNLPDEVHRAIEQRAAAHGRSTEDELRVIITEAVQPPERVKLGSLLTQIGRELELTDEDHSGMTARERTPIEPLAFDQE